MEKCNHQKLKLYKENRVIIKKHNKIIDNYVIFEHWHRSIEITYAINVDIDYWIDGVYQEVKKGEVILINSCSIHKVIPRVKHDLEECIHAITIIIPIHFFKEYNQENESIYFELLEDEHICSVKELIIKLSDIKEDKYSNFLKKSMVYELAYILFKYYKKDEKPRIINGVSEHTNLVHEIINYIICNYNKELKIEILAEEFSFSREHFSRIFKKFTRVSLKEYIENVRVNKAYEELMNTENTIIQIAMNNGFSDSKSFIRAFKKYFGKTPYKYKRDITKWE